MNPHPHSAAPAATLVLPLSQEIRTAYLELSDKYQLAIMSTADVGVLQALVASKLDVDNILTKDNLYRINKATEQFDQLLKQIQCTNADLVRLKAEIAAVAGNIDTAADILAAISKVLTLVPGI